MGRGRIDLARWPRVVTPDVRSRHGRLVALPAVRGIRAAGTSGRGARVPPALAPDRRRDRRSRAVGGPPGSRSMVRCPPRRVGAIDPRAGPDPIRGAPRGAARGRLHCGAGCLGPLASRSSEWRGAPRGHPTEYQGGSPVGRRLAGADDLPNPSCRHRASPRRSTGRERSSDDSSTSSDPGSALSLARPNMCRSHWRP